MAPPAGANPGSPSRPPDRKLRPIERVRRPGEFRTILRRGRCFRDPILRIHFLESRRELPRLGLVVSRKVGGAVVRNRVKRIIREIFRREKWRLDPPLDLVLTPSPQAGPRDRSAYAEVFERFIAWLGSRPRSRPSGGAP